MRRPSRTRRVLKWSSTAVCLLIGLGWISSIVEDISFTSPRAAVTISDGVTEFFWLEPAGARWYRGTWYAGWGIALTETWKFRRILELPCWVFLAAVSLPTAVLWYRDRRIPPGFCQNCGYNLTGNVSGRCPECGEVHGQAREAGLK